MALQMQQRLACHIADLRAYERVQLFCALLEGGHPVDFATRVDSGQLVPERLVRLERLIPVGHRHPRLRCAGSGPSRTIERRILAKRSNTASRHAVVVSAADKRALIGLRSQGFYNGTPRSGVAVDLRALTLTAVLLGTECSV